MYNTRKHDSISSRRQAQSAQRHFKGMVSGPTPVLRWTFTLILLVAVLSAAIHFSEEKDFLKILEEASPIWILVGLLLQATTYLSQSYLWKIGLKVAGHTFRLNKLVGLSLAQLFINQAIPSASVSGALLVSKALGQRNVPHQDVSMVLGLSLISYFEAYALAVIVAIIQLGLLGHIEIVTTLLIVFFILVVSIGFFTIIFKYSSVFIAFIIERPSYKKSHLVKNLLKIVEGMDFKRLGLFSIFKGIGLQLFIFFLDFLTLWSMIKAIGEHPEIGPIFTSYMVAFVARTVGFVPGGIGIFEAVAIAGLHKAGLSVAGSLAATLLYRGLSYWLPMIPGLFLVRREFYHSKRMEKYKIESFWTKSLQELYVQLKTSSQGLTSEEARSRLLLQGPNQLHDNRGVVIGEIIWNQIKSPLVLLLLLAVIISFFVGDWKDGLIILIILLTGAGIGAWRESQVQLILEKLKETLAPQAKVIRDNREVIVYSEVVVPGDVITLSAGDLVPADVSIIEAQDCYVNEASITGESFPVIKIPGSVGERRNVMFLGSHVQTGMAKCLVVNTGPATLFGALAESVQKAGPQTDFDRNITDFGYMMIKIMLIIVIIVFGVKSLTSGITIESLMFSVALAVGLSPELLPLIINYDLAVGAGRLAKKGLLVRHPKALENLGAVDVLCSDKSGTITEGIVDFEGAFDAEGKRSAEVLEYAWLNASLQTGMENPMDNILRSQLQQTDNEVKKIAEIPYDFKRKRLSVIIEKEKQRMIITKGAFDKVLEICSEDREGNKLDIERITKLKVLFEDWSNRGARVLGLSFKEVITDFPHERTLESEMRFFGFLVFIDKPKEHIISALNELKELGIAIKIISGDNTLVTKAIAKVVGLDPEKCITGNELDNISDEALPQRANEIQLFTQVDPHQKERIVTALRKAGHTVAYMGDGINDVSAMHASDSSISVDSAVDVAKSTADMVLLEKSLELVKFGIKEGRVTFHNSMKYINITMSANFGNMISMAVASLLLPFLPLLASQILLNNLLSDVPFLGIAKDNVDHQLIEKPTKWNLQTILKYMIIFGLISTFFDLLIFYALLKHFKVSISEFRTTWFVASLLTELSIVIILRTKGPVTLSRPSNLLIFLILMMSIVAVSIPLIPGAQVLGFTPLNANLLSFIVFIIMAYLLTTEVIKRRMNKGIN